MLPVTCYLLLSFMIREEITAEIKRLSPEEKDLKKFGKTMAVVFGIFSLIALYNKSGVFPYVFLLCLGFGFVGITRPLLLKKLYLGWMALALTLGFFMTKVILSLLFYSVFTIIGFIARLFNGDMLDQKYEAYASSYWKKKEKPKDFRQYLERQF